MPAVSKAQQAAAGMAHAAKQGKIPMSKLKGAARSMAKMKDKSLKHFAKTKTKGLPKKKAKSEGFESKIDHILNETGSWPLYPGSTSRMSYQLTPEAAALQKELENGKFRYRFKDNSVYKRWNMADGAGDSNLKLGIMLQALKDGSCERIPR